ncbi:hypothetical protein MMPV_009221 [Pyropia vietnamensis]
MSAAGKTLGGDDVTAVVIDSGSLYTRAGYAGDDHPLALIPSAVGTPLVPAGGDGGGAAAAVAAVTGGAEAVGGRPPPPPLVGDALHRAGGRTTDITRVYAAPDAAGATPIVSFPAFTSVLRSALNTIRFPPSAVAPDVPPLMLVEPSRRWSASERSTVAELTFEGEGVPGLFFARGGVTAAFAAARTTALVVDVGAGGVAVTPVVEGYALHKSGGVGTLGGGRDDRRVYQAAPRRWGGGGDALTAAPTTTTAAASAAAADPRVPPTNGSAAAKEEAAGGVPPPPPASASSGPRKYDTVPVPPVPGVTAAHTAWYRSRVAEDAKAALLYIPPPPLPDGQVVRVPTAAVTALGGRLVAPAAPLLAAVAAAAEADVDVDDNVASAAAESLPYQAASVIARCDVDVRRDLYGAVVLAGGGVVTRGLVDAFGRALTAACPQMYKCRVVPPPPGVVERGAGAWIGGSIMASLGTFGALWVGRREWEEEGERVLHQKCQ